MKPDTLFLSGGGINCLTFLGAFQYLFEKKIIAPNFQGIKNIPYEKSLHMIFKTTSRSAPISYRNCNPTTNN